jgi:hypothetical protein
METATKIKLSKETMDILKNYSSINSNIFINSGNRISTISPIKNILSEVEVSETFDVGFGIWDLPKFLGTISIFNDPELEFHEKYVLILNGNSTIKYYYSDPKLLTVPTKKINMPKIDLSFSITETQIQQLKKAASILGVSDLTIENNEEDELIIKVHDKKDKGSNSYIMNLQTNQEFVGNFSLNFMIENLKLIPDDYDVDISSNIVSRFTSTNRNLTYWIALEMDSTYQN